MNMPSYGINTANDERGVLSNQDYFRNSNHRLVIQKRDQ